MTSASECFNARAAAMPAKPPPTITICLRLVPDTTVVGGLLPPRAISRRRGTSAVRGRPCKVSLMVSPSPGQSPICRIRGNLRSPEPSRVLASTGVMRTLRYRAMKITSGCRRSLGSGIARHFARQVAGDGREEHHVAHVGAQHEVLKVPQMTESHLGVPARAVLRDVAVDFSYWLR